MNPFEPHSTLEPKVLRRPRLLKAAFVLLLVAAASLLSLRWYVYQRPLALSADQLEFHISAGSSARGVAQQAQRAGVGLSPLLFVLLARVTGATQHLRAGRYAIQRGATLETLLDKISRGDTLRERITVIEGLRFQDFRALLAAQLDLRQDTVRLSEAEVLRAVGAIEPKAEGLFAPDTYVFESGASDLEILRQAYRTQQQALQLAWERRAPGLPYRTPYEALTMASIIEKETGQANDRAEIAGVFINRLRRGMLLQTDPTVIYGLGASFDGNLRKRDLLADTPYNTYTRAGLPPTPISLPGRASIEAALQPLPTRAVYFVSRGDGSSHFSETLGQHNRAVDKYQRGIP